VAGAAVAWSPSRVSPAHPRCDRLGDLVGGAAVGVDTEVADLRGLKGRGFGRRVPGGFAQVRLGPAEQRVAWLRPAAPAAA